MHWDHQQLPRVRHCLCPNGVNPCQWALSRCSGNLAIERYLSSTPVCTSDRTVPSASLDASVETMQADCCSDASTVSAVRVVVSAEKSARSSSPYCHGVLSVSTTSMCVNRGTNLRWQLALLPNFAQRKQLMFACMRSNTKRTCHWCPSNVWIHPYELIEGSGNCRTYRLSTRVKGSPGFGVECAGRRWRCVGGLSRFGAADPGHLGGPHCGGAPCTPLQSGPCYRSCST